MDLFSATNLRTILNLLKVSIYVPTDANYSEVKKLLAPYIDNRLQIELSSKCEIRTVLLTKSMNSYVLVKAMRMNIPVKLAFNNQERVENFAGRVGSQIEADSLSLLTSFKDSIFLKENGFTKENVLVMFIPNTYTYQHDKDDQGIP
jgi:UPF0755 protein